MKKINLEAFIDDDYENDEFELKAAFEEYDNNYDEGKFNLKPLNFLIYKAYCTCASVIGQCKSKSLIRVYTSNKEITYLHFEQKQKAHDPQMCITNRVN